MKKRKMLKSIQRQISELTVIESATLLDTPGHVIKDTQYSGDYIKMFRHIIYIPYVNRELERLQREIDLTNRKLNALLKHFNVKFVSKEEQTAKVQNLIKEDKIEVKKK